MLEVALMVLNIRIEGKTASAFAAQPQSIQVVWMHLPDVNRASNEFKDLTQMLYLFYPVLRLFAAIAGLLYGGILEKVYQPAIALSGRGGRVLTQFRYEKTKSHNHHIYDDQTIENMIRYYKVEQNFDSLLRYIKSRSLREDVL